MGVVQRLERPRVPFAGTVGFVGLENYARLLTEEGLTRSDFMTSLRNNFYYVLLVVPLQTVFALFLAVVLNNQLLKAKGFFRTAFYFPSVTSSVAISVIFLFLFSGPARSTRRCALVGIDGPTWFNDARGLLHVVGDGLGLWDASAPPASLTGDLDPRPVGVAVARRTERGPVGDHHARRLDDHRDVHAACSWPRCRTCPVEVEEAARVDGANRWQSFRAVTLPHLRPTLLLVITLGIIGTWQVFDQVYVMTQGGPSKTTLTPAYLSYSYAFENQQWGVAAAMAFVLFLIIFVLTSVQRWIFRDKDAAEQRPQVRRRPRRRRRGGGPDRHDAPTAAGPDVRDHRGGSR